MKKDRLPMTGRYKTSSLLHLALLARWTHTYGTIRIFSEEKQSELTQVRRKDIKGEERVKKNRMKRLKVKGK